MGNGSAEPGLTGEGTYSSGTRASTPGTVYLGRKKIVGPRGDSLYMNPRNRRSNKPSVSYKEQTGNSDNLKSEYARNLYNDPKFLSNQINVMRYLGYNVKNTTQLQRYYNAAVDYAEKMYSSGTKITPLEALQFKSAAYFGGSGGGGSGGGGGGNGTSVQTQKSFNISSAKDAKAFINQSFQQELGREATSDEIKQFRKALNSEEKKNPTITKTTNVVSGSNVSTTSKTSGGMDRGAYSLEQAPKAKDYAEFQAETTFMDAMMSAIKGG